MDLKKTCGLIMAYGAVGLLVYVIFGMNLIPINGLYKTLFSAAVGFLATAHIFSMLSGELTNNHRNAQLARMVGSTINFVGFFAALLVFLFFLKKDVDLQLLLLGGSVGGIVLGFAAQKTIENVFAGVLMMATRNVEIGDRIVVTSTNLPHAFLQFPAYKFYSHDYLVQGYNGVVEEISIFFTKITLDKGLPMILPNSIFLTSGVVNITKSKLEGKLLNKVRYEFPLSFDPEITLKKIREHLGARFDLKDIYVSEKNQEQKTFIVVIEVFSHGNRESLVKSDILQELMRIERVAPLMCITRSP